MFDDFGLLVGKPSSEVSKVPVQRGRERETYELAFHIKSQSGQRPLS